MDPSPPLAHEKWVGEVFFGGGGGITILIRLIILIIIVLQISHFQPEGRRVYSATCYTWVSFMRQCWLAWHWSRVTVVFTCSGVWTKIVKMVVEINKQPPAWKHVFTMIMLLCSFLIWIIVLLLFVLSYVINVIDLVIAGIVVSVVEAVTVSMILSSISSVLWWLGNVTTTTIGVLTILISKCS